MNTHPSLKMLGSSSFPIESFLEENPQKTSMRMLQIFRNFRCCHPLKPNWGVAKTQWCRTGRHECWIYSLPFLQISAVSGDWKIGSWMLSNVYNIYMNITEYIYISYPSTLATMLYHITYVQNYIRKYHDKLRINRYHRYHSYNTSWNLVFSTISLVPPRTKKAPAWCCRPLKGPSHCQLLGTCSWAAWPAMGQSPTRRC